MTATDTQPRRSYFYRHSIVVRVTHWINVLCMTVLLMSGLQIFNAHPRLYIGEKSTFEDPVFAMGAVRGSGRRADRRHADLQRDFRHDRRVRPFKSRTASRAARGFPSWITLPSYQDLATGRRWHFFFAWLFVINGLVYIAHSVATGHWRQLVPTGAQLRHIGSAIREHLLLRFPKGEEAKSYNVLQKLAYFGVIVILVPVLILAGLTMSPAMDAAFPWLLDIFGGRQTRAHDPFRRRGADPALRARACADGSGLRRLEQHSLDDHRQISDRGRGESPCGGMRERAGAVFCAARVLPPGRSCLAAATRSRRRRGSEISSSAPSS